CTFGPSTSANSAALLRSTKLSRTTPALCTIPSNRPCSDTIPCTSACTCASSRTSTLRYSTCVPLLRNSSISLRRVSPSARRPTSTNRACFVRAAISCANNHPSPPAPPLIKYTPPSFQGSDAASAATTSTWTQRLTRRPRSACSISSSLLPARSCSNSS